VLPGAWVPQELKPFCKLVDNFLCFSKQGIAGGWGMVGWPHVKYAHGRRPRPKSGGQAKSENYWFEKPSFFKPLKTSKVQILGVLFFYLSCNL